MTVLDSGRPGPCVMIQALTHGNEFCGAIAIDDLLREGVRPASGTLTLAFANVAAYARFDFDAPDRSRYIDEDYNRVWGDDQLKGPRDSTELRRARELARFVDQADLLLDLHSMHEPCRPIMVCAKSDKSVAFARRIGVPADLLVDTRPPGGPAHDRARRIRRPGQPAHGGADRVRPALGEELGRRRDRHRAQVPAGVWHGG